MIHLIQAALERHLLLLPTMATAFENTTFAPVSGTPYQRVFHLLNNPRDLSIARDAAELRGILQVSLFFPLDAGRLPAMTRAELIADHFKPVQHLTEGNAKVQLESSARVSSGSPDGDRWHVPVSIPWRAFKTAT